MLTNDNWSPAEVWHPGSYLMEEMIERGWTADDVAREMGGKTDKERIIDGLVVMAICGEIILPDDENEEIGLETATKLARAFGTSQELWLNLDEAWHKHKTTASKAHRYSPAVLTR